MKPIEDVIEVAEGEPQLAEGSVPAGESSNAAPAIGEVTYDRMARHARALRLSRELRILVVVDSAGWLKDKIEIVYHPERRGAIRPYFVRVGHLAPDAELSGEHGVWARCRRYNAALAQLHQLAAKLATMVRMGGVTLVPGSAVAYAHQQLSRLDELIASRQAKAMGNRAVRLDRLGEEIEYLARCDAHLAPIIDQAERAAEPAVGDADTPQHPPARPARRWLRWLRGSHSDGAS
ncbi:MAG: hypothetical protein E6J90_14325 [Deltaproteobacteria bacterium]|nr:MAG: hypothetical protein E6J91_12815 [Deltaproteobacteria bacterium]TMQ21416.1 MAG: hypothetical protein E6J90_14325 [Deltaproteobacteria bacterium]